MLSAAVTLLGRNLGNQTGKKAQVIHQSLLIKSFRAPLSTAQYDATSDDHPSYYMWIFTCYFHAESMLTNVPE